MIPCYFTLRELKAMKYAMDCYLERFVSEDIKYTTDDLDVCLLAYEILTGKIKHEEEIRLCA